MADQHPASPAHSPTGATVSTSGRVAGLDLARALAIFGMVFVNFRLAMGGTTSTDFGETLATMLDGRAAGLFVVLAGVGVSLMSRRGRESGDIGPVRQALLRRAGLLFVLGLLYTPVWPADILHYYGVYLFAAAWCLTASGRNLWLLVWLALAVFVTLLLLLDYESGWASFESLEYPDFWSPAGFLRNTFFNGFHPFFPWVAFLLYGMWLGRLRLDQRSTCRRIIVAGSMTAVTAELVSDWLIQQTVSAGLLFQEEAFALFGTEAMPPCPLYLISAAGTATAVIGLCCRLAAHREDAAWLWPLLRTGQLALTMYVAHVIVGMGLLEALGLLGMDAGQPVSAVLVATGIFCSVAVLFSWLWCRRFARGPLETVFRRLADPRFSGDPPAAAGG